MSVVTPLSSKNTNLSGSIPVVSARHRSAREAGGLFLPVPDAAVFGIEDRDDLAWVTRRLRPHPYGTYLHPLRLPNLFEVLVRIKLRRRIFAECCGGNSRRSNESGDERHSSCGARDAVPSL